MIKFNLDSPASLLIIFDASKKCLEREVIRATRTKYLEPFFPVSPDSSIAANPVIKIIH